MSKNNKISLNKVLYTLCFIVLILAAFIMLLEIVKINNKTILQLIHLEILNHIKSLLLMLAVIIGAYPFAMRCKKTWQIVYWIIVILALIIFVFGWVHPAGINIKTK